MQRLSKKEYWDSLYLRQGFGGQAKQKRFKFLRTSLYCERILWGNLYQKYLPKTKNGLKILEVGSAPGGNLIKFHKTFAYLPYGVEYSEKGVERNRMKFISHHLDPNNVIHSDFFSDEFQKKHQEEFDIVMSRGFVEHFSDAKEVIKKHLNLLIPGGILIIIIPNFRGINYFLQSFFNKEIISMHNLDIMEKQKFLKLFDNEYLKTLYCNYFGTFNFGLFNIKKDFLRNFLQKACDRLQWMLNFIFYFLLRNKGLEHKFFSPYLIFIGKKIL